MCESTHDLKARSCNRELRHVLIVMFHVRHAVVNQCAPRAYQVYSSTTPSESMADQLVTKKMRAPKPATPETLGCSMLQATRHASHVTPYELPEQMLRYVHPVIRLSNYQIRRELTSR
jgi:hypothetical protein